MKKLFKTHATRLLLACLCIVTGFVHGWAVPYVIGNAPFGEWNRTGGIAMTLKSGTIYTVTVNNIAADKYFAIAPDNSDSWDNVRRPSNGGDAPTGSWESTTTGGDNSWCISTAGDYTFEYDTSNNQVRVTAVDFAMPDFCTWQAGKNFIYIEDSNDWGASGINVYTFNGFNNGEWPGLANVTTPAVGQRNGKNVYLFDVPTTSPSNVIISKAGEERFTGNDMDWKTGGYYTSIGLRGVVEEAPAVTYTYNVYVRDTSGGTPRLYVYGADNLSPSQPAWPGYNGTAVTNVNAMGKTWYKFTFTSTVETGVNVIANAGDGHQAATKTIAAGDYYIAFDGSKDGNETSPIAPVYAATTAPSAAVYLAGTFNGHSDPWLQTPMTGSGPYTATINGVATGDEFKVVRKDGVDETWLGGAGSGTHNVNPDYCTDIALQDGINFKVNDGYGDLTFTVAADLSKFSITGWSEDTNDFTIYVRSSYAPYVHVYYKRGSSDVVAHQGFGDGRTALSTTETLADGKSWYKLVVTDVPAASVSVIFTDGYEKSPDIVQSKAVEYYEYNYSDDNNPQTNVGNKNEYRLGVIPVIEAGGDLYLMGKANGKGWAPNSGIKMTKAATGHVFTLENVTLTQTTNEDGFTFAAVLADDNANEKWDNVVNATRLMAVSDGGFEVKEDMLGKKLSLERYYANRNWRMNLNGRFNITVDLDNEYVMIERANPTLYMMGSYYYGGKDYSFGPSDAAEMQTADGNVYTLSGVQMNFSVDANGEIHGNTFQFIKELTTDNNTSAYNYLRNNSLRVGAATSTATFTHEGSSNPAARLIEEADINVPLPLGEFTLADGEEYHDFEMGVRGTYLVIVNLSEKTVTLRPMAGGASTMTVHLEKTDNVVDPGIVAWNKLDTDPTKADFAINNYNAQEKVSAMTETTTGDGRVWYTWTIDNAIADFYFTRTNGTVKQSEQLLRRAGNVYYTWPSLDEDDTDDETRAYTYVAASGVPDCAQMLEDHYYVYFINTPGWDNVFCYAWQEPGVGELIPTEPYIFTENGTQKTTCYPGVKCELVGYDNDGYEVYRFDFTEYFGGNDFPMPTGVIFNNGVNDPASHLTDYADGTREGQSTTKNKEQSGDFVFKNGGVYDYLGMLFTGYSLGSLIVNGVVNGPMYSIDCELEGVYFDEDAVETIEGHRIYGALYCKDIDDFFTTQYVEKSQIKTGEIDYIMSKTKLMSGRSRFDQSNWIKLTLSTRYFTDHTEGEILGEDAQKALLRAFVGKRLPAGTIYGQLVNNVNPQMHVVDLPWTYDESGNLTYDNGSPVMADAVTTPATAYSSLPNVMVTANFVGTQECNEGYNHNGTGDKNRYYFVTPKPYEFVHVTWAVYDAAADAFFVPAREGANEYHSSWYNEGDLNGYFKMELDMLENATDANLLKDGEVYQFDAIVTLDESKVNASAASAGAPRRVAVAHKDAADNAYAYIVKPLSISGENAGVITAVTTVDAAKTVTAVRYYNMAGVESDKPFNGVNIVVTEYSDGSKTTAKQLK